jgi:hypothetical protein
MAVYTVDGRISLGQSFASSREAKRGYSSNDNLLRALSLHYLRSCQSPCPKYVIHYTSPLSDPTLTRTSVVACGLQFAQQACGFNTLMYYSATLFKEIGFNQPTAVGLIVSGTNFLFTLFALKYIDIIGRRRILLWSMPGMIFGLVLASVAFHCTRLF